MANVGDSLADLERHRLQLEENIAKLKKGLHHWRQWDAEYELLKEEIQSLPQPASKKDLARMREGFQSDLVDRKEIDDIFGPVGTRPLDQIVNVLERRIDYVTKNLETLEKQLQQAEEKHSAVSVVSQPDVRGEDGLPVTEIIEELDEDGNVVSHRLNRPGDSANQVRDMLEKAGVKDIPEGTSAPRKAVDDITEKPTTAGRVVEEVDQEEEDQPATAVTPATSRAPKEPTPRKFQPRHPRRQQPEKKPQDDGNPKYQSISLAELAEDEEAADEPARPKSVTFAEDTKPGDGPGDKPPLSRTAQRLSQITQSAKEHELLAQQPAVIPQDESVEDAFLRNEMLKYGMEEVGGIVAELNLEEGSDDDEGFDELEDSDDEDDDEDKFGRHTGSVIDDKYRQRMLELEQRLGVKSRFTEQAEKGGGDSDSDSDSDGSKKEPEGLGRIVIQHNAKPSNSSPSPSQPVKNGTASEIKTPSSSLRSKTEPSKEKKSVSFAQNLDIAPDESTSTPNPAPRESIRESKPAVEPVRDLVVERTGGVPSKKQDTTAAAKKPKRVSRFKQEKAASNAPSDNFNDVIDVNRTNGNGVPKGPLDMPVRFADEDRPTAPTGPEGQTIADTLVEREPSAPRDDDEDDDEEFLDQELADEYHQKRRLFIQRHGGFLKEDESQVQPLSEADGGRRISKFKAARLSQQ